MSDKKIIKIQFNSKGRAYDFAAPADWQILPDSYAVVNTVRGLQLGKVLSVSEDEHGEGGELVAIERAATEEDLANKEILLKKEDDALKKVSEFLRHSRFQDVKAISAEYSLDSARVTLFLNYDAETNFDIKSFLREVSHLFRDSRIEVRQVGPRDMAKTISGLGACGIEKRCCSRFLKDFSSISIKMAKAQDISLTPNEITGICGRLRCCMAYEYPTYEKALENLPKKKKLIKTPLGEGKVIQLIPLAETVMVSIPELGVRKFTREELESGVMAEKKPEMTKSAIYETHTEEDVEIIHFAPVPERDKPENAERRSQHGNYPRRHDTKLHHKLPASEGDILNTAGQDSAKSKGYSQRRTTGQEHRARPTQDAKPEGQAHQGSVRQGQNPQHANKANGKAAEAGQTNQAQKFKRPRREWIKKS
ncbi:MAG: regulatory iron-sulfur-containing complex subunit RicT [Anaerolineaceae bacterium]|nr:regulatory iron-sulfur-containing complex subunit RicT [Anaerolineaceae bacterium]